MDVGDYLLQYKTENNLSYYKLSKMSGISVRCLKSIIAKEVKPKAITCHKIAELTGIKIVELL